MRRFFAPEVVQTSNVDCGPAALKCLLEGFGTSVSYGRLREACQTGIDGTSIDTMESVANLLGLEAEQVMLPIDHLLLSESASLPAIVVVQLPNGLTHFVVLWRLHGRTVQLMDPGVGRRWASSAAFAKEIYNHTMAVPASDWRDFAASPDFQNALTGRFRAIGISRSKKEAFTRRVLEDESWRGLGALDAGLRLVTSLAHSGAFGGSGDRARLLERLCANPELIPLRYWSVSSGSKDDDGVEHVLMRGAVLVRIRRKRAAPVVQRLDSDLAAAVREAPLAPSRELMRFLWESGPAALGFLSVALAAAAGGVIVEALLFRGLFDIADRLGLVGQRVGALTTIVLFSFVLLVLEIPAFSSALRLGRQIENRLRMAFLKKSPKLGDRYFQSRLTSDMAERSHSTQRLRHLPDIARQLARGILELCATAVGIIWLEPSTAPFVLFAVAAALVPAFTSQSLLAERDLRVRSHAAGLTRFYLDAMLGLLAIRAHGAERSVRREHEKLLGEWGDAAIRLQRAVVSLEALQLTTMFGLVAWLLLSHSFQGTDIGRVLLVAYWALNLPTLRQNIGTLARQYPYYRNLTLRLLDPLGAPEEVPASDAGIEVRRCAAAPRIAFHNVSVEISGHTILNQINFEIEAGSQIAIVGVSGAGKSSLAGVLLGWLKPSSGEVLVDDAPLNCEELRMSTAWVDPAIQLWNNSLFSNLAYGADPGALEVGRVIDAALLRNVLESLPEGLQTKLGEGGALVSGGEGQRVRLGRAMLRKNSKLVILDEPFRGLDREKRRELLRRAREFWLGSTMLCITHDLEETQGFDRVFVIEHGCLIEDSTPEELSAAPESRYGHLLTAEAQTRSGMWCADFWRRIRIHSGRIVEQVPKPKERSRESEVA
ncbi:MAG: ATP-binding cassette domain-containing protein [Acidobacteriaceae bacterium]|nr:ATP-binding cassette domain-containing protein [Acidobacteriaceae bacterium]